MVSRICFLDVGTALDISEIEAREVTGVAEKSALILALWPSVYDSEAIFEAERFAAEYRFLQDKASQKPRDLFLKARMSRIQFSPSGKAFWRQFIKAHHAHFLFCKALDLTANRGQRSEVLTTIFKIMHRHKALKHPEKVAEGRRIQDNVRHSWQWDKQALSKFPRIKELAGFKHEREWHWIFEQHAKKNDRGTYGDRF